MAENTIKTRIQLKYDSYDRWSAAANQFVLKKGEVAIATLAPFENVENPSANSGQHPVLFKVGDGAKTFNQLPWASALAADVHEWAKKSEADFTAWVAKTPKTVTLTVNNVNTDYTIEEAIKLVRNEITAGGEAAAITIADESTAGKIKYTAKQGGTAIVESIEVNAGTGINIAVKDNVPEIVHQAKPTTGNAATATKDSTGATTFVTGVKIDDLGHVAGVDTADITVGDGALTTEGDSHITVTGSFSANQTTDSKITVVHNDSGVVAEQYGADEAVTVGAGETKTINIPSVTVDAKGHVTAAADKTLSITIPELPTNHVTTNTEQDITATKTFKDGAYVSVQGQSLDGANVQSTTTIRQGQILVDSGENTSFELDAWGFAGTINGEDFALSLADIATKADVVKAVDYLGTINSLNMSTTAGKGDFYRVSAEIKSGDNVLAHAGDLLIAEKDNPANQIDGANWSVIHGEEGDITKIIAGEGLTDGGSVGEVTVSHAVPTGASAGSTSNQKQTPAHGGTFNIPVITTDKFGHVTGKSTAEVQLPTDNNTTYDLKTEANTTKGIVVLDPSEGSDDKVNFVGAGGTTVKSDGNGTVTITTDLSALATKEELNTKLNANGWEDNTAKDGWTGNSKDDTDRTVFLDPAAIRYAHENDKAEVKAEGVSVETIDTEMGDVYFKKTELTPTALKISSYEYGETYYDKDSISYNSNTISFGSKNGTIAVEDDLTIYGMKEGSNENKGSDKTAYPKYLIFDCGSATEVI